MPVSANVVEKTHPSKMHPDRSQDSKRSCAKSQPRNLAPRMFMWRSTPDHVRPRRLRPARCVAFLPSPSGPARIMPADSGWKAVASDWAARRMRGATSARRSPWRTGRGGEHGGELRVRVRGGEGPRGTTRVVAWRPSPGRRRRRAAGRWWQGLRLQQRVHVGGRMGAEPVGDVGRGAVSTDRLTTAFGSPICSRNRLRTSRPAPGAAPRRGARW